MATLWKSDFYSVIPSNANRKTYCKALGAARPSGHLKDSFFVIAAFIQDISDMIANATGRIVFNCIK
jgi:hypothetical protein